MTEQEMVIKLQEKAQETTEFTEHQNATEGLVVFLGDFIPKDKSGKLSELLGVYAQTAGKLAQAMDRIAEEIAEEVRK